MSLKPKRRHLSLARMNTASHDAIGIGRPSSVNHSASGAPVEASTSRARSEVSWSTLTLTVRSPSIRRRARCSCPATGIKRSIRRMPPLRRARPRAFSRSIRAWSCNCLMRRIGMRISRPREPFAVAAASRKARDRAVESGRVSSSGSSFSSRLDASCNRRPVVISSSANSALRSPLRPRHVGSSRPSGSLPRSPTSRNTR
jgi:hypothetical protein